MHWCINTYEPKQLFTVTRVANKTAVYKPKMEYEVRGITLKTITVDWRSTEPRLLVKVRGCSTVQHKTFIWTFSSQRNTFKKQQSQAGWTESKSLSNPGLSSLQSTPPDLWSLKGTRHQAGKNRSSTYQITNLGWTASVPGVFVGLHMLQVIVMWRYDGC